METGGRSTSSNSARQSAPRTDGAAPRLRQGAAARRCNRPLHQTQQASSRQQHRQRSSGRPRSTAVCAICFGEQQEDMVYAGCDAAGPSSAAPGCDHPFCIDCGSACVHLRRQQQAPSAPTPAAVRPWRILTSSGCCTTRLLTWRCVCGHASTTLTYAHAHKGCTE
jgi:hypothetical protein